jgi:hypothetical protein
MVEYSRTLVPLWFNDGNEEFPVRSIEDLKRFWNSAHIEKIIEYLHDGSFERFFFALRKDELTQLIVELKWKGTPDLEIVNEVGSRLGFEPLATLETERDFIKQTVPLEEVFSQKGELKLLPGEWTAQNLNVIINEPLTIRGSGNQKTLVHTGNLSINANGELILEDLTFKAMGDTGEVRVKEGEVIFKNVHFSGVKLYIEGGKAITEDCCFENLNPVAIEISEKGDYESRGKIDFCNVPPNSQIRVRGIDIRWEKDITLHHNKEEEIYSLLLRQGVDLKEVIEKIPDKKGIILPLELLGTYNLDGYTIKNKKLILKREVVSIFYDWSIYPDIIGLVNIEDSEVTFENIQFEGISAKGSNVVFNNCKGKKIQGITSQITINGSEIHGNKGNGIMVEENSTLKIKDSKVYKNGTESQSYSQIYVENSKAEISTSLVYNSKGGAGIYGKASQITINSSEIYGNKERGIEVEENSILTIKDSRVYENGEEGQNYPQIWVENSKAEISTAFVYNSKDGNGISGIASQITINSSEVHGNKGRGISVEENSTLEIEDTKVYENDWRGIYGKASQITITNSEVYGHSSNGIYIFNSTLIMEGSQVYKNGYNVSQIDIYGKSVVKIKNSMIYEAKGGAIFSGLPYGIYISNSASKVELENVKTWGNSSGLKCNQYGTSVLIKNCEFKDGTIGL